MTVKWNEWLASREAKRELLRRLGLDAPSRRKTSYGTSDLRMRSAFGGRRIPAWAEEAKGSACQ